MRHLPLGTPLHPGGRGKVNGNQLVVLHNRLWVNPEGDAHALQCVARTTRGEHCRNPIENGQVLGVREFQLGTAGYVSAYGHYGQAGAVDADRWLAQHCSVHDIPDVRDHDVAELRRFDITRDASFLRPYRVEALFDGQPDADVLEKGVKCKLASH